MIDDRPDYIRTDKRGPKIDMNVRGRVVSKTAVNGWRKMVSMLYAKSGAQGVNPIFSVSANANRRSGVNPPREVVEEEVFEVIEEETTEALETLNEEEPEKVEEKVKEKEPTVDEPIITKFMNRTALPGVYLKLR